MMRRSSLHSTCLGWYGILSVAGSLGVWAGDKVTVSGPKKSSIEAVEDKESREESSKSRESLFYLLRTKPSVLNPFSQGESFGGGMNQPILAAPSATLDPISQKRLLEKLNERKNWLQEGTRSSDSAVTTLDGISANTNSLQMFLTPGQRARVSLDSSYSLETFAPDVRKTYQQRQVSPLEAESQILNGMASGKSNNGLERSEGSDGGASRGELGVFGFIHDQVGEKSMFEFERTQGSHEYGQNSFLPGFTSSTEAPKNTMFGNHLQVEPKSPFGGAGAISSTPAFGSDSFGSTGLDGGGKSGFGFGGEAQAFGSTAPVHSAFTAPEPVIARPTAAPVFVPRPAVLPLPTRGL